MAGQRIVVLTGAGISAESGLGTFRDTGGMWAKFDPYELATPEGFASNPAKVQDFYNLRRADMVKAEPNRAHYALAGLQERLATAGGDLTIVTQNIDDLHERAGARGVIHMHGELLKARCEALNGAGCGAVSDWTADLGADTPCPACAEVGTLRPHVVWFGEFPLYMEEIEAALVEADMFVSIGTSGTVYPAAGFVLMAKDLGLTTVELNLEPSEGGSVFDETRYGAASAVVPEWVDSIAA